MNGIKRWLPVLTASTIAVSALAAGKLVCGLTGKELTKCCCTEKNGKLVCTETGKTLDKCCCTKK